VSIWFAGGVFVIALVWASWALYGERRAHNKTLDRFMAVSETLGAYQARREGENDEPLWWQDSETGEMRPLSRGGRTGVEDVEGSMQIAPVTEDSVRV
jgi:hypothetical protein